MAQLHKRAPTTYVLNRIRVLFTDTEDDIIKHKQTAKWKQLLEGIVHNTNLPKLWELVRDLNNRKKKQHP